MKELDALIRKWDSTAKGTMKYSFRKARTFDEKRWQPIWRARAGTMREFVKDLKALKAHLKDIL